jgi:hypothetical protein
MGETQEQEQQKKHTDEKDKKQAVDLPFSS